MSVFAVTAGKGGAGRSCVAAYTAVALARRGKRVLAVEMGAASRSLDLILGARGEIFFDLSDVLAERCEIAEAILPIDHQPGLFLLPGSPFLLTERAPAADFSAVLRIAAEQYDHLILDGADFRVLAPTAADTVLLVLTPHSLSARAAAMHAGELYGAGVKNVRLVINKVPPQLQPIAGARDFDDLIDMTGAQLAAVIPQSPKLEYASNHGRPLGPDTITHKVFDNLASRLCGVHQPLLIR